MPASTRPTMPESTGGRRRRGLLGPFLPAERFTPSDRRIAGLMYLAGLFLGYAQAHAVNTLPFVRVELGLTEGEMSLLLGVTRMGALAAVGFSMWGDRRGRKAPFLTAFGLLMVMAGATALVPSAGAYGVTQFLARSAGSAVGVLAAVLLTESLSPAVRAYGLAIFGAAASFGAGIATIALPVADRGFTAWRWLFAASVLGLVLLPFLVSNLNESPIFRRREHHPRLREVLRGATGRRFAFLAAISFVAAAYGTVAVTFVFERLVSDLGFSTPAAVAISLTGGTIGGIGFPLGGRLADAWGRRPTALLALVSAVAGGAIMYTMSHPLLLTAAAAVSGFGSFALTPALGAQRTELFPTDIRATAVVWVNAIAIIGGVGGLAAGRWTIDAFGLTTTVIALGMATLGAALLELALPETRLQPMEP